MQNALPFTAQTIVYGLAALATFFGIPVSALLAYFLGKRRQTADILQSTALTRKTEAESRQIDAQIILETCERLVALEGVIQEKTLETTKLKQKIDGLEWELGLADAREKVLNQQVAQAHAELEMLRKPRIEA